MLGDDAWDNYENNASANLGSQEATIQDTMAAQAIGFYNDIAGEIGTEAGRDSTWNNQIDDFAASSDGNYHGGNPEQFGRQGAILYYLNTDGTRSNHYYGEQDTPTNGPELGRPIVNFVEGAIGTVAQDVEGLFSGGNVNVDGSENFDSPMPFPNVDVHIGGAGIYYFTSNSLDVNGKADAQAMLAFLKANSPTFNAAMSTILADTGWISIDPISAYAGGRAESGNALYGEMEMVRDDGSIIYAAYILAHEIGHLLDGVVVGGSSAGMVYSRSFAPNGQEAYATNFANTVSAEVAANARVNIGSQRTYFDNEGAQMQFGPLYPGGPTPNLGN